MLFSIFQCKDSPFSRIYTNYNRIRQNLVNLASAYCHPFVLPSSLSLCLACNNPKCKRRYDEKSRPYGPTKLKVIFHNDDVTDFSFVVQILVDIFFKSHDEALALTIEIEEKGSAVVGVYVADIANSKVEVATRLARQNNFPLRITTENA